MSEIMSLLLFAAAVVILLIGYPVAISLAGTGLLFAGIGYVFDLFDPAFLEAVPNRIFGVMGNETLIAVPLFVFMGVMLEKAKIAEELLDTMALLFGPMRGGLGISVCIVGMLLAASAKEGETVTDVVLLAPGKTVPAGSTVG